MESRTELIHRALLAMAERLIKALPYPDIQVNKKNYICLKCSIAFPIKSFFKET